MTQANLFQEVNPNTEPILLDLQCPIHFVGIGGVGMSGLAKLLIQAGFAVSGSDLGQNSYTEKLAELGVTLYKGHQANQVPAQAMVIVSSSIDPSNPEIACAIEKKYPIYHRSQLLKTILQGPFFNFSSVIGITGTHGKTSITGMTGVALKAARLSPSIVVGGKIPELNTNAWHHTGNTLAVAELDESDGSLLQYQPTLSLIANLELDHADFYTTGMSSLVDTFVTYLSNLKENSTVLFNVCCPNTKALVQHCPNAVKQVWLAEGDIFNGTEPVTTYWLKNVRHQAKGCYQGYVYQNQKLLGELTMGVPGKHNLTNGLCAIALGIESGSAFDDLAPAVAAFGGMGRRFERVGSLNNAVLIDDYAHHPTEVAATLQAASQLAKETHGKVIAVFQPHRYTRLQALWQEFLNCFAAADHILITDVYAASEAPVPGVDSVAFVSALAEHHTKTKQQAKVLYCPDANGFEAVLAHIQSITKPGDIVISMGAGNITTLFRKAFARHQPQSAV
ncbi:MAG: UDP-N-acetylmuramate--L-alanine ligase [Cyanobacteria bacterium P01_H01_bin.74]